MQGSSRALGGGARGAERAERVFVREYEGGRLLREEPVLASELEAVLGPFRRRSERQERRQRRRRRVRPPQLISLPCMQGGSCATIVLPAKAASWDAHRDGIEAAHHAFPHMLHRHDPCRESAVKAA